MCYRHQQGEILSGYSECIKTTNGVDFDRANSGRKTYRLNKDYNQYARMTTFNGHAVLIGIIWELNHSVGITKPKKYVEVFDEDESKWLLKNPSDESVNGDVNWSAQYALVPLKNKLLHLGGNDIGEGNHLFHNYVGYYLDTEFSQWIKLEQIHYYNDIPGTG